MPGIATASPTLPAPGGWDGVTASAHLGTPYEDPRQAKIPFGLVSYYMEPWRSYMDTWSGEQWKGFAGANFNADPKYAPALARVLSKAGIRTLRIEIGWGGLNWNDQIPGDQQLHMDPLFAACRKYGMRPMILLNANHGAPCPMRDVPVTLTSDAHKGDKVLHLTAGTTVKIGYTGVRSSQGIAAYPFIVKVDPDGTAHLSAPLGDDIKAGNVNLQELKYQPFQGDHLADGTPVPACQETFDGWIKYVSAVAAYARFAMGTTGAPDAGFDLEVWNEQTFGSNFLNIDNYYDTPPQYKTYKNNWVYVYKKTRPLTPSERPDAQTDFEQGNYNAILPMTVDFMQEHKAQYPGVKVISGLSNQEPFSSGSTIWDGQAGLSRHYYTGGWIDISPTAAPNLKQDGTEWGTIDALGNFDGKHNNKDWGTVEPGSTYIPTVRIGYPEQRHGGFQTEYISRDLIPDSRWVEFDGHGRYTNNGDLHPAEIWQTEVNYYRGPFFDDIFKDGSIKRDDPKALALDEHLAAKCMLRQFVFHNHKDIKRIYLFAVGADPYSFGMFPKRFYDALDASYGKITPDVVRAIPEGFSGLDWITKQMDGADKIAAPRPLKVTDLVEYKPRLVWAGDGTPAHPNVWNRDWFTFLPYQLSTQRYLIPYYVQTVDVTHVWDEAKPVLDPARYDMPAQDYDVTVNNIRGLGARVSALDSITMQPVPVRIVAASANSLTVRLSAVDYPRFLTVDESGPGPSIIAPKVQLATGGKVRVTWQTNVPAAVSLTYGSDWENRSAHEVDLPAGTRSYVLPAALKGVVAVRIKVSANGLSDVWPRWDEDPQGQIVVPGGAPAAASQPSSSTVSSMALQAAKPIASLIHGRLPLLPKRYSSADGLWSISLPTDAAPQLEGDGMEAVTSTASGPVNLRVRYIVNGSAGADQNLPFTSTIDSKSQTRVLLASGIEGTLYDFMLDPAAHPGELNLRQTYLFVPAGPKKNDLIVVSVSGRPEAVGSLRGTVVAMASSLTTP